VTTNVLQLKQILLGKQIQALEENDKRNSSPPGTSTWGRGAVS